MDNQNQETPSAKNSSGKAVTTIVILIVLVVIAVGGYFWYHSKKTAVEGTMTKNEKTEYAMKPSGEMKPSGMMRKGKGMMDMKPQPTPTLTEQQTKEVASGAATTTTEKTFHINGGNFYLVPNNITVNKGDKVTFVFTDDGGFHDVVIDELGLKTDLLKKTGEQTTATFTADKAGSFVYYCDVGQHRQLGMQGTLTVK
jgi:plastocyanin